MELSTASGDSREFPAIYDGFRRFRQFSKVLGDSRWFQRFPIVLIGLRWSSEVPDGLQRFPIALEVSTGLRRFPILFRGSQQLRDTPSALDDSGWSADGKDVRRSVFAQRVLLPVDPRREHRHHDAVRHRPGAVVRVRAALVSNRWWLRGAQHHRISGSDGAAGAEPGAA